MNIKSNLPLLILHVRSTGPRHGYAILQDLERRGLIEAFEETVSARQRRCYHLTEVGRRELARQINEWQRYSQAVNLLLGDTS